MRFKYLMKRLLLPFTVRIRAGALQGRRWVIASGSRFVKGTYEPIQSAAFQQLIQPGDVVFDVGAHVGYYTVLSSLLTGERGQVIAFEPLPANLTYLRRHVVLNACDNVRILPICLGERTSVAQFDDLHGTGVGHLDQNGTLEVQVRSLDELVESSELPVPQFLKIDVEGAELLVLCGAERLLRRHHPTLILSTHSTRLDQDCLSRLTELGYHVEHLEPDVLVAKSKVAASLPTSSIPQRTAA